MKFQRPEDITALDLDALNKAQDEALEEFGTLGKIEPADLTDEQFSDTVALREFIDSTRIEKKARAAAAKEREEAVAAARDLPEEESDAEDEEPEAPADKPAEDEKPADDKTTEGDKPEDTKDEAPKPVEEPAKAETEENEPVSKARVITKQESNVVDDAPAALPQPVLVASAGGGGLVPGETDMDGIAQSFWNAYKAQPGGSIRQIAGAHNKISVATITNPARSQFSVDEKDSAETVMDIFKAAAKDTVSRLRTVEDSVIVAGGGWCVPTTPVYDLANWATAWGALQLPEVTVTRGGIQWIQEMLFDTIFGSEEFGFIQTEEDAINEVLKPIFDIVCPEWEEIRLLAIGYGVRAPILTGSPAGFPELIRHFLDLAVIAHYYRENAFVISEVLRYLGAPVNFQEKGSATSDLLEAVEFNAIKLREKYLLEENALLEGMFPVWVKAVVRADLSRRGGVEMISVTDEQIVAWFRQRNVVPQFVRGFQDIKEEDVKFADTLDFGLWVAGTFVKGTNNVIQLDSIYDSVELRKNSYTALFTESAILVANMHGKGQLVRVSLADTYGRVGAAELGSTVTGS